MAAQLKVRRGRATAAAAASKNNDAKFAIISSDEHDPFVSRLPQSVAQRLKPRALTPYEEFVLEQGTRLPWHDSGKTTTRQKLRSKGGEDVSSQIPARSLPFVLVTHSPQTSNPAQVLAEESLRQASTRRDGYSDEKCRFILNKHCSWIPRQYDYAEGMKRVYPTLREYLGDENLDLATGVLYEMIEVGVMYTWEEGAVFQRWKFDHLRRDHNFENTHVPSLGNVIVGSIVPTATLRRYRQHKSDPPQPLVSPCSNAWSHVRMSLPTPDALQSASIRSQKDWQIEYSCFVSDARKGTRVHKKPPSAADLHMMVWDAAFGVQGRLINHRKIEAPSSPASGRSNHTLFKIPIARSMRTMARSELKILFETGRLANDKWIKFMCKDKQDSRPIHSKEYCGCDIAGHTSPSAKIYDLGHTVKNLPDPDSESGREFYRCISNQPLPEGKAVPTEAFAKKNDLIPKGIKVLPATLVSRRLATADDLAVEMSAVSALQAATYDEPFEYSGPFTNELFKDGAMDFRGWKAAAQPKTPGTIERNGNGSDIHTKSRASAGSDKLLRSKRFTGWPVLPHLPIDLGRLADGVIDEEYSADIRESSACGLNSMPSNTRSTLVSLITSMTISSPIDLFGGGLSQSRRDIAAIRKCYPTRNEDSGSVVENRRRPIVQDSVDRTSHSIVARTVPRT